MFIYLGEIHWRYLHRTTLLQLQEDVKALGRNLHPGYGVYLWGAQLNEGTSPNSYVKTQNTSIAIPSNQ
jgi:hypothetical protein